MPFLDVVTATIGIFLLIFAVQVIQSKVEVRRLVPDLIILCLNNNLNVVREPAGPKEQFEPWQAKPLVSDLLLKSSGLVNVVLAIGPDCGKGDAAFTQAMREVPKDPSTDLDLNLSSLRLMKWPVPDSEAADRLLADWDQGRVPANR